MGELATERLRLEALRPSHAEGMWAGLQAPEIYTYIAEDPPVDIVSLRGRYERLAVGHSADGAELWFNWAIWAKAEARYVGYVQATVTAETSIAYVLFPDAWGQGYAREAVAAMVDHIVMTHRLRVVRATVDTRNARSAALLRSLGFKLVTVRKEAEWIHDVLTDEAEYAQVFSLPP